VQGSRWYDLTIDGVPVHAGPTPMEYRIDPVMGATRIVSYLYKLAAAHSPWGRATFGNIFAEPASRNTVPERVVVNVDLRHPDAVVLDAMDEAFRRHADHVCGELRLNCSVSEIWHMPVTMFDPDVVHAVRSAATDLGLSNMDIVSGAGHDALYVAKTAPTGMIFIPCRDGVSHNPKEYATPEHMEAGANVLLHAMLRLSRFAQ